MLVYLKHCLDLKLALDLFKGFIDYLIQEPLHRQRHLVLYLKLYKLKLKLIILNAHLRLNSPKKSQIILIRISLYC